MPTTAPAHISDRRREANRRNALRSTGPRTTEGKARSSQNAVTHGCTAQSAAPAIFRPIRHESPDLANSIRQGLVEAWKPANAQEAQAIEIAVAAYIRIQRADAFESALISGIMDATQLKHGQPPAVTREDDLGCGVALGDEENQHALRNLDRYRRHAHLDYHRAIELLRRLQHDRLRRAPVIPRAVPAETQTGEPATNAVASFRPLVRTAGASNLIGIDHAPMSPKTPPEKPPKTRTAHV